MNAVREEADDRDRPVCDPETLGDLASVFGTERLAHLLGGLDEEIVLRLATATEDTVGLGANAHALVSVSGTLGFAELSRACMVLEHACIDGGDLTAPLRAAQVEAARARPAIARLRAGTA